jgi:hypothetical protein
MKAYKAVFTHYFDVWGNKEDGWEVNNLCCLYEDIDLPDLEDETLIGKLKELGFFNEKASTENTEVVDYYPYLEVVDRETQYPFGRFEILEEEE